MGTQQSTDLNFDSLGKRTSAEYANRGDGTSKWFLWTRKADGGDAALGATTDAAASTGNGTLIAVTKRIRDVLHLSYNSTLTGVRTVNTPNKVLALTVASAAYSATGGTGLTDVDVSAYRDVLVVMNVTAISGTATVTWQNKNAANTYGTIASGWSATIASTGVLVLQARGPLGLTGRVLVTPGTSVTGAVYVYGEAY